MGEEEALLQEMLDTDKLKYCYDCGTCTASCPISELLPGRYSPRGILQKISFDFERVLEEEEIWLCAGCHRCYKMCPQRIKIPEIIILMRDMAAKRDYLEGFIEALKTIKRDIPLPAVCSYICFNPLCGEVDKEKISEKFEQFIAEYKRDADKVEGIPQIYNERIAIVGSGPAGLTAAQDLARMGYPVTIFESMAKAGGMLRKCIPEYRLPKDVVDAEVERTKRLGVDIKTDVTIGSLDDLSEYDAIFVAIGAHKSRKLGIEGEDLNGVIPATTFLWKANKGEKMELGDKVAIVGGGNSAIDAARTAVKRGIKEVYVLYRRSKDEMPASPIEIKEAEDEGVKIRYLVAPSKILGKEGRAVAMECIKMELGELDDSGRRRPIPIKESEFNLDLDTIIPAIGEMSDLSSLPKEITGRNTITADPFTQETDIPGVYAGGDVVSGPATAIEAIIAGRNAAISIDRCLRGKYGTEEKIKEEAS